MSRLADTWSIALAALMALGVSFALGARAPEPTSAASPESRRAFEPMTFLLVGGGPSPEMNQVQIEADVALAESVLRPRGRTTLLFAGGAGSRSVQVGVAEPGASSDLRAQLAELFAARGDRSATYRETRLEPQGPATVDTLFEALSAGLDEEGEDPLTLVFVGHGDAGESPLDSRLAFWGGRDLWVDDLAFVLDELQPARPLRVVLAACHAGGFTEILFDAADEERGAAASPRCGLFATTWDRVASGCDPNPDRSRHEGYALHVMNALDGRDPRGERLPLDALDIDGDGAISWLEAHARARVMSGSFDIPTTTSERWLELNAPDAIEEGDSEEGESVSVEGIRWPEESWVIEQLTARVGLEDPRSAAEVLAGLTLEARASAEALETLDAELEGARAALIGELLHRWPRLDDPWHPEHAELLEREGREIDRVLRASPAATSLRALSIRREALANAHDALLLRRVPLERIDRALSNIERAERLARQGGEARDHFLRLLACERGVP